MIAKAKRKPRKRKPSHRWSLANWFEAFPGREFVRVVSVPPIWYYLDHDDHGREYANWTPEEHKATNSGHELTEDEYRERIGMPPIGEA